MTFYALLVATSGEDTSLNYTPYPEVLGLFENKEKAEKMMEDEINGFIQDSEEDSIIVENSNDCKVLINQVEDYCFVYRIQKITY